MSALPNPQPYPRPVPTVQRSRAAKLRKKHHQSRQRNSHRVLALEAMTVLGVNALLIGVGIYTLTQLVPYQLMQQAKLREMNTELNRVSNQVQQLQQSYQRSHATQGAKRIAEKQGHLIPTTRKGIVWVE